MRFIRKIETAKRIGWHPSHLMRMAKAGKFPKPVALGPNSTAFVESEVLDWMKDRVANRNDPLKNWAEVKSAWIEAINNPGPKGESALIKALNFQQHSRDAKKFSEAHSAESQTWGRRK